MPSRLGFIAVAIGFMVGGVTLLLLGVSTWWTGPVSTPPQPDSDLQPVEFSIRRLPPLGTPVTAQAGSDSTGATPAPLPLVGAGSASGQRTEVPAQPTATAEPWPTPTPMILSLYGDPPDADEVASNFTPDPRARATQIAEATAMAEDVLAALAKVAATATAASKATASAQVTSDAAGEEREPSTSAGETATPEPPKVEAFSCPGESSSGFDLIPIEGAPLRDHPAAVHGDLNLALRGYLPVDEPLGLVDYKGLTDGNAPHLSGLFEPNRGPQFTAAFHVNDWAWDPGQCGGHPRGCPAPPPATLWPVTLIGLATSPGETITVLERGPQIYGGGYVALVLYAERDRLTLGYTRRDTVATGYVVQLEQVCIDPNLLRLYEAQIDAQGWLSSGHLPGLRSNQALGVASGAEIRVAVRDAGTFMDPRSRKDWWD
jgi:hypothetical protein